MKARQLAITVAVLGFFVLAIVGWCSGLSTDACALRALVGMVALYGMVRVATRVVVRIMADALVRKAAEQEAARNASRGRRT